ncbi:uncharacterized protein LOC105639414 isoform X2 [Jatropha curcas]|uniref:uncharacterized protein LOC105639414 isoform X2 n=1 Tax=Jatropha curcas TaxID=180498 RepID=UPI0009D6CD05|nr:uncharacterized protein LOC105639414 isoform X2 [Jatropha curcas]
MEGREVNDTNGLQHEEEEKEECGVILEIPLGIAAETFDFKKTVCSHGLFAMSPNQWDPLSYTFSRPLRLRHHSDSESDFTSVMVSISHPSNLPHSLLVRVHGTRSLTPQNRESLVTQVLRMLRLSDADEMNIREFRKIIAMGEGEEFDWMKGFSGRVFRSPTLFEDMVKCILLCNCQWSRTLSMARALCELQLELQFHSSSCTKAQQTDMNNFIPKTPVGKESQKRKGRVSSASSNLSTKLLVTKMDWDEVDTCLTMVDTRIKRENLTPNFSINSIEDNSCGICKSCVGPSGIQSLQQTQCKRIWNFPSPWELANLDERFLSKRCGLGYRAGRIIKLSQGIVEGRIPMRELEQVCNGGSLNSYNELADQLKEIDGFGPFTRANVLMCMGFYHVIPADSETVRHIKQCRFMPKIPPFKQFISISKRYMENIHPSNS